MFYNVNTLVSKVVDKEVLFSNIWNQFMSIFMLKLHLLKYVKITFQYFLLFSSVSFYLASLINFLMSMPYLSYPAHICSSAILFMHIIVNEVLQTINNKHNNEVLFRCMINLVCHCHLFHHRTYVLIDVIVISLSDVYLT